MVKLTITSVSFILTAISALVSASPAKKGVVTVVVGQIFHDTNVLQNDVSSIGKHITFKKALVRFIHMGYHCKFELSCFRLLIKTSKRFNKTWIMGLPK